MHELSLTLANTMDALQQGAARLESFFAEHALHPELAYRVSLAYEELVSNTIKYGYADQAAHEILVHAGVDAGFCRLSIEDDSHTYDPFQDAPAPDVHAAPEDRPIGGLGVYLIKQTASSFQYSRKNGRNTITLEFRAPGSSPGGDTPS